MLIPEGYAQINLLYTGDAAPTGAQVTFGADISGTAGDPMSIGSAVVSNYISASMDELHVGALTLSGVLVKFGPNETGPFATYPADVDGSAANPSVLVNGALLVHKTTDSGGRSGRGRMFFPGIPENQTDSDGTVHGGYLSTIAGLLEDWRGKLITDLIIPVLLHSDPETDLLPTEITGFVPQAKLATQRRRLRR